MLLRENTIHFTKETRHVSQGQQMLSLHHMQCSGLDHMEMNLVEDCMQTVATDGASERAIAVTHDLLNIDHAETSDGSLN